MNMMTGKSNNEQMLSLYDYLGKAAGPDLGIAVWHAAKKANVKPDEKEVSTRTYSGKILTYPVSFLNEYFGMNKQTNNFPF